MDEPSLYQELYKLPTIFSENFPRHKFDLQTCKKKENILQSTMEFDKKVFFADNSSLNLLSYVYFKLEKLEGWKMHTCSYMDKAKRFNAKVLSQDKNDITAKVISVQICLAERRRKQADDLYKQLLDLKGSDQYSEYINIARGQLAFCYFHLGPKGLLKAVDIYEDLLSKRNQESSWSERFMFYKYYLSQTYSRLLNRTKPVKDIDQLDYFRRFEKLLESDRKISHSVLSTRIHVNLAVAYNDLEYNLRHNVNACLIEDAVQLRYGNDSIVLWLYGRHLRKLFIKHHHIRDLEESISVLKRSISAWETRHKTHHNLALAYKSRWQFEKKHFLSLSKQPSHGRCTSQGLASLTNQMKNLSLRSVTGAPVRNIDILLSENPLDDIPSSKYLIMAAKHLDEAIKLDSGTACIYLIDKSRVCTSLHEFKGAQRCLRNAQKVAGPDEEAYLFEQWGLLYQFHQHRLEGVHLSDAKHIYHLSVHASMREKRPSRRAVFQLLNILQEEEEMCEDRSKIQEERAELLVLTKNYDEAIALLQELPDSIMMLVEACVKAERFVEAYTYLLQSLKSKERSKVEYKRFFFETAINIINHMDKFSQKRIYGDLCKHFGPSQMEDYAQKEYDVYLYRPY